MAAKGKARNQYSGKRPIRIEGALAYVPLTRGYEAIIDVGDLDIVASKSWSTKVLKDRAYAQACFVFDGKKQPIPLHRVLINPPPGMYVDHINGDTLNNRRNNLRLATPAQNVRNQRKSVTNNSGFKGVYWHRKAQKWIAQIQFDRKRKYLGLYTTPEAAHAAYVEAAKLLHGDFARFT